MAATTTTTKTYGRICDSVRFAKLGDAVTGGNIECDVYVFVGETAKVARKGTRKLDGFPTCRHGH
jgi:hypothetical protein